MANPTSKVNLVINGVTTQLDIHDSNAVDLTNNQTVGGNKEFTGTTTAHDVIPSATNTYNLGSPSAQWNNAYTRNMLIDNDINIASSLINKTSNSGVLTMRGGISDTEGASISLYGKDYDGSPGLIGNIYMTAYGNSDYTNFRIYPNGIIRVTNNSTGTTKNVAMREDVVPRSGGAVLTGSLMPSADNSYDLGSASNRFRDIYGTIKTDKITHRVDNDFLQIYGGTNSTKGAAIRLNGKDLTTNAGYAIITANDGAQSNGFQIRPNGDTRLENCAVLYPNTDNSTDVGAPAYRFKVIYAATGTINTSDSRLKNSVKDIDDRLLDAWENVEPKQYKFNDATEKKGEKARYHTGYLAQNIQAECEKQGVNASDYGLFCYDEWEEQEEISEEIETEKDGKKVKEKRIIQPKREKGNMYALRYEEALVVECKYLRRCIARLTARIEELEKGNNTK